ncbi:hypothetical protein SteCoe_13765 [Stentor coeruleus]|uniref:Aurora kinase n=1 Tax=Stentor coeruleus TaxID=5963 RepID=A0A1R2C7J6_9CILI|nr:hypothetical protein SteCoe_13765 [Stentor coeruleus]
MEVNKVKRRLLFLPPSVANNSERECNVGDFQSLSRKAIGEGAFGQVFKVRHIATGSLYAIKVISKAKILERNMVEQLKREVRIMYSINHPNIIKLHNHFEDDNNVYMIMELAEGGNLFQKLCKFKNFDERTAAQYLREVALAVQYLHTQDPPIIHRDIKPENIFLDSQGRSKLGDFGWSSVYDSERCTYCGTLEYLAPEMIDRIGHGLKLDMWNLGVLLFELLVGEAPFRSKNQSELFKKIKDCKIGFPKNFSLNAKDLVRKLLKTTAEERICVEEILEHPWMKENPPLRTTIGLSREVRKAPNVPETPVVNIPENEYLVISGGVIQTKLKKVQEELSSKQEYLEALTQKIQKITNDRSGSPKKNEDSDMITRAQAEVDHLGNEYANYKKLLISKYNNYALQASRLQIQKNNLAGLKTFVRVIKWMMNKSQLGNYATDTRELLIMFKEPNLHPLINAISQSMRDSLLLKPELGRVYNNTYLELEKRNKDIAQLENDLNEIRGILALKKEVYSALGFKDI